MQDFSFLIDGLFVVTATGSDPLQSFQRWAWSLEGFEAVEVRDGLLVALGWVCGEKPVILAEAIPL